jgi:hypothetical protein
MLPARAIRLAFAVLVGIALGMGWCHAPHPPYGGLFWNAGLIPAGVLLGWNLQSSSLASGALRLAVLLRLRRGNVEPESRPKLLRAGRDSSSVCVHVLSAASLERGCG